jgi:hypothetical protein
MSETRPDGSARLLNYGVPRSRERRMRGLYTGAARPSRRPQQIYLRFGLGQVANVRSRFRSPLNTRRLSRTSQNCEMVQSPRAIVDGSPKELLSVASVAKTCGNLSRGALCSYVSQTTARTVDRPLSSIIGSHSSGPGEIAAISFP